MKILCQFKSGGEEPRLRGFGNALIAAGFDFRFWRPEEKSTFDTFDEFQPDIFIGTTFDLTSAMMKCIAERPNLKVVLKGSNFGPTDSEIRKAGYPVVIIKDDEKFKLEKLKATTGRPDFVMCHYHPNRLEETMSGWRELGIEPVALMNAADIIDYGAGTHHDNLASDICFVGGYWGYKAINLDRYILPLCYPVGERNIKIWGNQKWPVPQYLGAAHTSMLKDIFASAKVSLNVSEPHSNDFGFDVVERPFKVLSAGGFCISDKVDSLTDDVFTTGGMVVADDPDHLSDLIAFYSNDANKKDRDWIANHGRTTVYMGHTYFHRAYDMLTALGMQPEADRVIATYYNSFLPADLQVTANGVSSV